MNEYVDHNWLSEQRTSKHNKFNGLHEEDALLSLNGLPPMLLRSQWFASEAEEATMGCPHCPRSLNAMVCLVDEMHLGTDGQATAGTIPSLLFLPLQSHFALKLIFSLDFFSPSKTIFCILPYKI